MYAICIRSQRRREGVNKNNEREERKISHTRMSFLNGEAGWWLFTLLYAAAWWNAITLSNAKGSVACTSVMGEFKRGASKSLHFSSVLSTELMRRERKS